MSRPLCLFACKIKSMKPSLPAIIVSVLIALNSFSGAAQGEINKLRLGLTATPTINWITSDNKNWDGNGAQLGISYGVLADFVLVGNDNYLFSTGFTLNHSGGSLKYPSAYQTGGTPAWQAGDAEAKYSFRYIDIPLAIKLRTNEVGYLHYYGMFGASTGFNIGAKREIEYSTGFTEEEESFTDDVNLFRAGLIIGGGVEFNLSGNTYLMAGLTYHNGFTNILKGDTYLTDDNGNVVLDTNGEPQEDRKINTRQNMVMLNIAILF